MHALVVVVSSIMSKPGSAISQTILYGFSIVAMKGISILMLPFIAQRLTQPAFGRLEVLSSLAVVISIIVGLGLEDTLYRFAGRRNRLPHWRPDRCGRSDGSDTVGPVCACSRDAG